jgi:hypothetical protein
MNITTSEASATAEVADKLGAAVEYHPDVYGKTRVEIETSQAGDFALFLTALAKINPEFATYITNTWRTYPTYKGIVFYAPGIEIQ